MTTFFCRLLKCMKSKIKFRIQRKKWKPRRIITETLKIFLILCIFELSFKVWTCFKTVFLLIDFYLLQFFGIEFNWNTCTYQSLSINHTNLKLLSFFAIFQFYVKLFIIDNIFIIVAVFKYFLFIQICVL